MLKPFFFVTALFSFIPHAAALTSAVWEPGPLTSLESHGLALKDTFPGKSTSNKASDLSKNPAFKDLSTSIEQDLNAAKKKDTRLSTTMATAHRLFNIQWLNSTAASFQLVAITNRMDRRAFNSGANCGEFRLIYRLAYDVNQRGHAIHSRLPFTMNLVFLNSDDQKNCATVAKRWDEFLVFLREYKPAEAAKILLTNGTNLKTIEVNMQSVRWPSTTRGDLGAHAEYLLRVFQIKNGRARLALLENTPASERISKNPRDKKLLEQWIRDNLRLIDQGTAVLPDEFLATKATSVSPRGLARRANRPWSTLFKAEAFNDIDFTKLTYLKSPEALIRRLDDNSCIGCHQNRSVAGFHILGIDRKGTSAHNAIAVPGSPHFMNDLSRREEYLAALLSGKAPSEFRPLSERATLESGGHGAHCGLGDPGFKDWTCNEGLACRPYGLESADRTVGQCFADKTAAEVGGACEVGSMLGHSDPHKDRVRRGKDLPCGHSGVCEANYVGFPEGMCAVSCNSGAPDMSCGAIAVLQGFNDCLGRGHPFTKCLDENTRPAGLRSCGVTKPCRDDYICAGLSENGAACIPPYFLFQMRVDGHPRPPQN